jgi:hypothetical protein
MTRSPKAIFSKAEKNLDSSALFTSPMSWSSRSRYRRDNYPNIFRKLGNWLMVCSGILPEGETVSFSRSRNGYEIRQPATKSIRAPSALGGPMQRRELSGLLGAGAALPVFDSNLLAMFRTPPKSTYTLRTLNPHQTPPVP